MTKTWPSSAIDHRDNDRSNNRWANLRLANLSENGANSKRKSSNTSGYKGVYWNKQRMKWCAKICPQRQQIHLGFFDNPEDAHAAYQEAAQLYFGEFARAA